MLRSPLALLVAASSLTLSGCSTFTDADVVVGVGDVEVDDESFEPLAQEYVERGDVFGTSEAVAGRADANELRFLVGAIVRQAALLDLLDEEGIEISDLRESFLATLPPDSPLGELSPEFRDLIADVDDGVRTAALARLSTPNVDELRAGYGRNPTSVGLMCLRHVLVDTEADAEDVMVELDAGADFAELAIERSTDPSASDVGGALATADNACIPLRSMIGGFDPGFVAGALEGREGVPIGPVESAFGWHVILHRPWDEVADSVVALHQPGDSGGYLFDGMLATTDVRIDPRYGVWDPLSFSVVPLG